MFGGICIAIYCFCLWASALSSGGQTRTLGSVVLVTLLGAVFCFSRDWQERGKSRLLGGLVGFALSFVSGTAIYLITRMASEVR